MRTLGVVSALSLAALVPAPAHAVAPQTVSVSMKNFAFSPASVTIKVGDKVTWTYDESPTDPVPNCESVFFQEPSPIRCPGHSTTSEAKGPNGKALWDSGVRRADGFPFSFTFTAPGSYRYICTVHGGAEKNNPITQMEGDIVVEASPPDGGGATGSKKTRVQSERETRTLPRSGTADARSLAVGVALLAGAGALTRRLLAR